MNIKLILISFFGLICANILSGQIQTITYELNGNTIDNRSKNPFQKFIGEWTLKNDSWTQNWGGETETIKILGHHTVNSVLNTANSLLSIIDGPEPNGHIFWTYNPNTKEVGHLSSFGEIRIGVGKGKINGSGDVELKIVFEGEPENTYRIYNYTWVNENEYHMKSVQYDNRDKPTGLFYEGTFIRTNSNKNIEEEIRAILEILDNNEITKEEQIQVYAKDVVHMAPDTDVVHGKDSLLVYLKDQVTYGYSDMKHTMVEFSKHGDAIIMRGEVRGTFYPKDNDKGIDFQTKNLFVFERVGGVLKITKVIYNRSSDN